jgi:hypothetical protein
MIRGRRTALDRHSARFDLGRNLPSSRSSPDIKAAILYSLSAMTSYGHANLYLSPRWQLIGALAALNGTILFSLSTAFLFTVLLFLLLAWQRKVADDSFAVRCAANSRISRYWPGASEMQPSKVLLHYPRCQCDA